MTDDQLFIAKIKTIGTIIKPSAEQLPYGNKSRGRLIPAKDGRRAILVPSFGALEKEEVDYYVEKGIDDENARIKKNEITPMKEAVGKVTGLVMRTPRKEKLKMLKELSGRKQ